MERRELLRTLGAAAAIAIIPHREALAAWSRVASQLAVSDGLSDAQLALIGSIADAILPRTDSPSATDVGVPQFINVVVSENYTDADRSAFVAGLDAIDATAHASTADLIDSIEALPSRRSEPARTYWRLKGLIIHGYFTSEPVMKQVLKVEVMPGRFDGSAPMPATASGRAIQAGSPPHG